MLLVKNVLSNTLKGKSKLLKRSYPAGKLLMKGKKRICGEIKGQKPQIHY